MMKRTLIQAPFLLLAAMLVTAPSHAADKKPVAASGNAVATVNGKAIPKTRLEMIIGMQKSQGRPDSEELRKAVLDRIITLEAVAQEALKAGVDKKPMVQAQIDLMRQEVLINAYLADYAQSHPVGNEAIKKEYEARKTALGDKEYKAHHILVEKEGEAKDIIARLKKGEKFEDLAKQSNDPGSKDKGGDLDWATPSNYVKPFADALVKLEKGKYTDTPVQTQFGWHVIRLDDTRQFTPPSLDDIKQQISQELQGQLVNQHVQELRKKAKVE